MHNICNYSMKNLNAAIIAIEIQELFEKLTPFLCEGKHHFEM